MTPAASLAAETVPCREEELTETPRGVPPFGRIALT